MGHIRPAHQRYTTRLIAIHGAKPGLMSRVGSAGLRPEPFYELGDPCFDFELRIVAD
jgi:hypothetical protein